MRKRARLDRNHAEIVLALRKSGASVQSLASVGEGCPDILVGKNGITLLMEIKDGLAIPCEKRLTDDQKEWHAAWRGQVCVVESAEEALKILERST